MQSPGLAFLNSNPAFVACPSTRISSVPVENVLPVTCAFDEKYDHVAPPAMAAMPMIMAMLLKIFVIVFCINDWLVQLLGLLEASTFENRPIDMQRSKYPVFSRKKIGISWSLSAAYRGKKPKDRHAAASQVRNARMSVFCVDILIFVLIFIFRGVFVIGGKTKPTKAHKHTVCLWT